MDINRVIAIVRRLREEPERTAEYKAMHKKLYPRGSTIDAKTGKNNAIMSNVGGFSNPKNRGKKRKVMGEDAPTMSMGGGGIAGSVEGSNYDSNFTPPVDKKKKKNIYLGLHSRKRWLDYINGKGSGKS